MKKWHIFILSAIALYFIVHMILGFWIENKLEKLINSNPDRKYDIHYENIDLNWSYDGLVLEDLTIVPLSGKQGSTTITGNLESLIFDGLKWTKLLLNNELELEVLYFEGPQLELEITGNKKEHPKSGKSFQELFADILSRVHLIDFKLTNGSVRVWEADSTETNEILVMPDINISAFGVETSSVQMNNLIPFKLERLQVNVGNVSYKIDDYSNLKIAGINYRTDSSQLEIKDINIELTEDRLRVSQLKGYQTDVMELHVKAIKLHNLKAQSSFYDSLDIEASWIEIDSLIFDDFRNKHYERPPETEKPMFNGYLTNIPFPLIVDSITLKRSQVLYAELAAGQQTAGVLDFSALNGSVTGVSNRPEAQGRFGSMKINFTSDLYGQYPLDFSVDVPYEDEKFVLDADIRNVQLPVFNPMVIPLTGLEIEAGNLHHLHLHMDASRTSSNNQFLFTYSDLKVALLTESRKEEFNNIGFLSGLANSAVRGSNLPEDQHYFATQNFITQRNLQRSPFNFMWTSIKDGLTIIVPSGTASLFIKKKKKK